MKYLNIKVIVDMSIYLFVNAFTTHRMKYLNFEEIVEMSIY